MKTVFKRLIILDDDSLHNIFCILLIKKFFQDNNMDIIGFTDPQEGISFIKNEYQINPVKTILFLDINMPVLNGWQVLDHLAKMNIPVARYFDIYILSSSVDNKDIELARDNRLVKSYLEKPLSKHLQRVFSVTADVENK